MHTYSSDVFRRGQGLPDDTHVDLDNHTEYMTEFIALFVDESLKGTIHVIDMEVNAISVIEIHGHLRRVE